MKTFKRLMAFALALLTLASVIPLTAISARAAPNADIPESMLDSYIMRAWEYIGMDVQSMKDNGTIFVEYGTKHHANILYATETVGCSGLEKVVDNTTVTGYAPDVERFGLAEPHGGLVCASFVAYYVFNYMRWIEGIDCTELRNAVNEYTAKYKINVRSTTLWHEVLSELAATPGSTVKQLYSCEFENDIEIPQSVYDTMLPGDIITFGKTDENGKEVYVHTAVYAGEYRGNHFIIPDRKGGGGRRRGHRRILFYCCNR